ncbi:hypothetical protein [Prochlorococcus marinus]|uniref:hypothetical protein n=1 Tax=Prochlorococcus marinus TaxID=1219 RepID=UPI001ADCDF01|nr:hypothetical protein [Prochlorococcus marinus]MBO8219526.1 hypothetical protein [Prochlorococcus marinus CUG1416]
MFNKKLIDYSKIDFKGNGFQYSVDICNSIENYTQSILNKDKNAFNYRDINMRYSIERCIYIKCINSKSLFLNYEKYYLRKNSKTNLPNLSPIEKDILYFILNKNISNQYLKKNIKRVVLKKSIQFWRNTIQNLRKILLKRKIKNKRSKIIISINHIKFLSILKPILSALPKDSFIIEAGNDEIFWEQIKKRNYKVIDFKSYYSNYNHLNSSNYMVEFLELFNIVDDLIFILKRIKPKSILVIEGVAPKDILISEVAKSMNISTFCVQHGYPPFIDTGFRNMQFSKFLAWGTGTSKLLQKYNPKQEFMIVGNHSLKTKNNYKVISKKKFKVGFFLQGECALLDKKEIRVFYKLILFSIKKYKNIDFIIREHPSSKINKNFKNEISKFKNVIISYPEENSISNDLESIDIAVSVFSSVIMESIALNVVPLICSFGTLPKYIPEIAKQGAAVEVFNLNDAKKELEKLLNNKKYLKEFKKSICKIKSDYFSDKNTIKIIKDIIL